MTVMMMIMMMTTNGVTDSRMTRDAVLLSWLARHGGLSELPVYRVPWASLALHVSHCQVPPTGLLAAVNMAVVDLCHVDQEQVNYTPKQTS